MVDNNNWLHNYRSVRVTGLLLASSIEASTRHRHTDRTDCWCCVYVCVWMVALSQAMRNKSEISFWKTSERPNQSPPKRSKRGLLCKVTKYYKPIRTKCIKPWNCFISGQSATHHLSLELVQSTQYCLNVLGFLICRWVPDPTKGCIGNVLKFNKTLSQGGLALARRRALHQYIVYAHYELAMKLQFHSPVAS